MNDKEVEVRVDNVSANVISFFNSRTIPRIEIIYIKILQSTEETSLKSR